MKIKIFTTDSNGKISLSKSELEGLLMESYEDGFNAGRNNIKKVENPVQREFVYNSEPQPFKNNATIKTSLETPKAKLNASPTYTKLNTSNDELVELLNGIFGGSPIGNSPAAFTVNTRSNPSTVFDKLKREVEGV